MIILIILLNNSNNNNHNKDDNATNNNVISQCSGNTHKLMSAFLLNVFLLFFLYLLLV